MSSYNNCKVTKEEAIAEVIQSIALEEKGIAKILDAEGEKILTAIDIAECVDDLCKINECVRNTIIDISKMQMLLQYKLELACECECSCKSK
ncbi:MAG: hypothetical protein ACK5LV_01485 [Lachnospirales bacterium]